jgi:hypothetical protein
LFYKEKYIHFSTGQRSSGGVVQESRIKLSPLLQRLCSFVGLLSLSRKHLQTVPRPKPEEPEEETLVRQLVKGVWFMSNKNPKSGKQKRKDKMKERERYWEKALKERAKREKAKKEEAEKDDAKE